MQMGKYFSKEGVGKVYSATKGWVQRHPVPTAVGIVAASALIHTGLSLSGYDSLMWQYPELRYVPYLISAIGCGECNIQRVKNEKGRDLTWKEKLTSGLYGAAAPMLIWETWEQLGSEGPVYKALQNVFGNLAKQDFPGKGSWYDFWLGTIGGAAGTSFIEAGKTGTRKIKSYFSK